MTREPLPPEVWERVKTLFEAVRPLAGEERAVLMEAEASATVRDEVRALVDAADGADGFLEPAAEPSPLETGRRLGPYEIRDRLGAGGMGEVYRAYDSRLRREVAIKVLTGWLVDPAAHGRFQREARAVAALSHANVLAVHDVGDASGVPYIVTELLSGENLRERLRRGPPPVGRAREWAAQIALGLAAAHEKGIVHRDLKPENVFLLDDGRVKILDFGLARLLSEERCGNADDSRTLPGMILGTAGYLAPEQAQGKPATTTADIFALGAILFELLTGRRAFHGSSIVHTVHAVVEHEPPPVSSLRSEVPSWLDRVVARCLAKDVASRFQSARDLAFVLAGPLDAEPDRAAPGRRGRRLALVAGVAGVLMAAAVLWQMRGGSPVPGPPLVRPLTHSGRDGAPAVSPDGRFLAFTSDRDGGSRLFLQQLDDGHEAALTEGPDEAPRFSPDGGQILFTRAQGRGTALYRVALLGGEVSKVADDATDGDWSPDGRQVVFVRWRGDALQARPSLIIAGVDGSGEREVARLENRIQIRPRWSPDGRLVAVTGLVQQPGAPQTVTLVPVDGGPARSVATPSRVGMVSAVAWDGPNTLVYSQASSVTGNLSGRASIVRQRIDDGGAEVLLWTQENSLVVDLWPGHGIVFDARSPRLNLREVGLSTTDDAGRFLSRGTAMDRQPIYSPDGERIAFSSNRGRNLDVWVSTRSTGATRRLTDHPADDWDPAFTADGRHLLFSSNRSGNFEVWMADTDGSYPRQVTHDSLDAENPTATPDCEWIAYSSGAPGRKGVWRIRPDGSDAALLVPDAILPEVSPDGKYVLYQSNRSPRVAVVGVASFPDGARVPFEIRIDVVKATAALLGRARWMPDGKAIAFVGQDERGLNGVYMQPFAIGEDTTPSRTRLAGFQTDATVESFAVSPGADHLVLAEWERRSAVLAVTGLPR